MKIVCDCGAEVISTSQLYITTEEIVQGENLPPDSIVIEPLGDSEVVVHNEISADDAIKSRYAMHVLVTPSKESKVIFSCRCDRCGRIPLHIEHRVVH